jgi:hypothetical protein
LEMRQIRLAGSRIFQYFGALPNMSVCRLTTSTTQFKVRKKQSQNMHYTTIYKSCVPMPTKAKVV